MKNFRSLFLIATVVLLFSCSDNLDDANYFKYNESTFNLKIGVIEDEGTDYDLTCRIYNLEFKDYPEDPTCYIKFRIYSTVTTRLQEGVYEYDFSDLVAGNFSYFSMAKNLQYDGSGIVVSGQRYSENDYDITGTITIGKKNSNYTFDFNLNATDRENGSNTFTLTGHFEELLEEGYIYL